MANTSPDYWRQVFEIYEQVADTPAPDQLEKLDELTSDESIRAEVREMLLDEGSMDHFLDIPAAHFFSHVNDGLQDLVDAEPTVEAPTKPISFPPEGTIFGPYRVLRGLGIGGMGQVVLAERSDGAFERQVALKILPPHHAWEGANNAALAERNLLAKLEHEGIARLFDAGTADNGTPWFAMEYVDGIPIDQYVRTQQCDTKTILRLFIQVCEALQYAHQRLIVHRDVKPNNIFITKDGQVKLLDFGIAKQLDSVEGELTTSGLMTPRFATPEQVLRGIISTATDVYALGLVFYELLTGQPAYGMQSGTSYEWQERVLNYEPKAPSKVTTDPSRTKELAGDLDAILLKAIRKAPRDRYQTVAALADDLKAHLNSRPVSAVQGTGWYNFTRFVKRHRRKVAAVGTIAAALLIGIMATLWQSQVAARERDRAIAAEAEGRALHEFLVEELLSAATPEIARGDELSVREVLDLASGSVDGAFKDQPALEISMRLTLAQTYTSLGKFDAASDQALAALQVGRRHQLPLIPHIVEIHLELARIKVQDGAYDEAIEYAQSVIDTYHAQGVTPDSTVYQAEIQMGLAQASTYYGDLAEARIRPLVQTIDKEFPDNFELRTEARQALVHALSAQLKLTEAEEMQREILNIKAGYLDKEHPDYLASLRELGRVHFLQIRYTAAEEVYRGVLQASLKIYGEEHPMTAYAKHELALALYRLDQYDEAKQKMQEAYDIYTNTLGLAHPRTVSALRSLAIHTKTDGHYEKAKEMFELAYDGTLAVFGEHNRKTLIALRDLYAIEEPKGATELMLQAGNRLLDAYEAASRQPDVTAEVLQDYAEFLMRADPPFEDIDAALPIAQRAVEVSEGKLYQPLLLLGRLYERQEQWALAETNYRAALALPEGVMSWSTERSLARLYEKLGEPEKALAVFQEQYERRLRERGPNDDLAAQSLQKRGELLLELDRLEEAEDALRNAADQFARAVLPSDWRAGWNKSVLGEVLTLRGNYDEAESWLLDGFNVLDADEQSLSSELEPARDRIVQLYLAWGKPAKAEIWKRKTLDGR